MTIPMTGLELDSAAALALLPLALLPLVGGRREASRYPSLAWLPPDPLGRLLERLWRALAALTIATLVVGLAGPGRAESRIERVGRGAELSILLDRSSSMDATVRRNAPEPGRPIEASRSKNDIAREALARLVAERPGNRYALTLFNVAPMRIAPFTDDAAIVQAGLAASGIGRGPSQTDMGRALLAAIEAFANRDYSGSRAIILVSDGGARLEAAVQARIARELLRYRIALYFVYVKSSPNSPNLETVGTDVDSSLEEVALHVFFAGLDTPYRVYEADDPASMAAAVTDIDALQNLPLTTFERVPRVDYRGDCFALALGGTLALLALGATRRTLELAA